MMRCGPIGQCRPDDASEAAGLKALVRLYRLRSRPSSVQELEFFRRMPSLELAVHHAALATDERGKRYSHQCRIPGTSLNRARTVLVSSIPALRGCKSFHDLHSLLVERLRKVRGLGELYCYDTALRIGAFFGLSPELVYLHSGTRVGAKALGLNVSGSFVAPEQVPAPVRALSPSEIEDFLCIYKDRFIK
jgi:hypothetical protein